MNSELPYVTSSGYITKVLDKIIEAKTPPKFTQDYLRSVLGFSSSSARPVIPFLKRLGFLADDGSPTDLYSKFRSTTNRGAAAAKALKTGYSALFEANEYVYSLNDSDLTDLVIQITGFEKDSRSAQAIVGSFKAVNHYADFDTEEIAEHTENTQGEKIEHDSSVRQANEETNPLSLGLAYTINLNLPATSDIAVFDAIFKSLKENLLK